METLRDRPFVMCQLGLAADATSLSWSTAAFPEHSVPLNALYSHRQEPLGQDGFQLHLLFTGFI